MDSLDDAYVNVDRSARSRLCKDLNLHT